MDISTTLNKMAIPKILLHMFGEMTGVQAGGGYPPIAFDHQKGR
jgi:hypothetical protein